MVGNVFEFEIAEVGVRIVSQEEMLLTESFRPFLKSQGNVTDCVVASFKMEEYLPNIFGNALSKNQDFQVFCDVEGRQVRLYHDHDQNDRPYAVTQYFLNQNHIQISYLEHGREFFSESGNSFFHIGWEKVLNHKNRLLLHASCVNTQFGGILFSGVSKVGKSTQANLWRKYEQASLINGDRSILHKKDGCWKAYGSPYAGSSKCYVNDSCDITAIVFLEQASENSIRSLNGAEAFRRLYSGLTINSWDNTYVNRATDLAMQLLADVPMYELKCVPELSAVEVLKKELEGICNG